MYNTSITHQTLMPEVRRITVVISASITIDDKHLDDAEHILKAELDDSVRTLNIHKE